MHMKYAAAEGPGVQDTKFADVLAKLDIRAGQRAHRGAIEVAQVQAALEDRKEVAEALL